MGLVVLLTPLAVSGLGAGTFGSWGSATLKGAGTYHGADVTFRVGKLLKARRRVYPRGRGLPG